MSKAASDAKTPLLAGGAALAGAAGGLAIGTMRSRQSHSHKVLGLKMPQGKRVKIRSRDVARAAREVGAQLNMWPNSQRSCDTLTKTPMRANVDRLWRSCSTA